MFALLGKFPRPRTAAPEIAALETPAEPEPRRCDLCSADLLDEDEQFYCHACGGRIGETARPRPGAAAGAVAGRFAGLLASMGRRDLLAVAACALALLAVAAAVHEGPFGPGRIWPFCVLALAAAATAVPAFRGLMDRERRRLRARLPGMKFASMDFGSRESRCGLAAVALSLLLLTWAVWGFATLDRGYLPQWCVWMAGALLVLIGFCLIDRRASELAGRLRAGILVRVDARNASLSALLALVLAFAAVVRVVQLDAMPVGLNTDEMAHMRHALELGNAPTPIPLYVPGQASIPPPYLVMLRLSSEVFGPSPTSLRLASAALGVAGVFATFLLGRRIGGTALGILAAVVLASLAWHINFSRIGWDSISGPLCAALAMWGLLRALDTGRVSDFALAGVMASLGLWFYEGYYAFPFLLATVLLIEFLRARPELRRTLLAGAAVMGLVAVVWTAPLQAYAVSESAGFTERMRYVFKYDDDRRADSVRNLPRDVGVHLRVFHFRGDSSAMHNVPGKPLLDDVSGALLILGLGLAAARWRRTALLVIPLWLVLMMAPSMVAEFPEHKLGRRITVVLPAVALLAALPLYMSWRGVALSPGWWRLAVRGAVVSAVALMGYFGVSQYFGEQARHELLYRPFNADKSLLAQDLREQLESGYAAAVTSRWDSDTRRWAEFLTLWPEPTMVEIPGSVPIDPNVAGDRKGVAVYIHRDWRAIADAVLKFYPNARVERVEPPGGGPMLYYRAVIDRSDLWAVAGLASTDGPPLRDTGVLARGRAVSYRGALHVRRSGEYEFLVQNGRGVSVRVGDVELGSVNPVSGDAGSGDAGQGEPRARVELEAGLYEIEIASDAGAAPGAALLWRRPDDGVFAPIAVPHLYHGAVDAAWMRELLDGG